MTHRHAQHHIKQMRWLVAVTSTHQKQRQKDQKFKVILNYIGSARPDWVYLRPCFKEGGKITKPKEPHKNCFIPQMTYEPSTRPNLKRCHYHPVTPPGTLTEWGEQTIGNRYSKQTSHMKVHSSFFLKKYEPVKYLSLDEWIDKTWTSHTMG